MTARLMLGLAAAWIAATAAPPARAANLPQAVQAQYEVTLNGAPVGVMHDHYEARDGRYRIVSETHATGVLALVQRRPARVVSSGEVLASGLRPLSFEATRGNDARRVSAEFDWNARTLTLTHDGRSEILPLPAGTQDRLSALYQFMFLGAERLREVGFAMTNGRKLDQYRYTLGGDTALDTALGRLAVIHLVKRHAPGETATEIWLARDRFLLPVRMRIVEDDGSRYEQSLLKLDTAAAAP
jgi:hypothetical protein